MDLLTTKQAAKNLGMSTAFLERDRWAGAKVPFGEAEKIVEEIIKSIVKS